MDKKTIIDSLADKMTKNVPIGIQTAILPLEDLESVIKDTLVDVGRADTTERLFDSIEIDLKAFTDGMTDADRIYFLNLFGLQVAAVNNYSVGATQMILWRKFLIPMAQRKQALEKMILALGGEKNAATAREAD